MQIISFLRSFIKWALFIVLMLSVLAFGANRPVAWVLMCLAIFILFGLSLCLNLLEKRPSAVNRLWLPGVLYLAALAWGALQMTSGVLPADWAHPVWSYVDGGAGTVSAAPNEGWHILMRLSCYAMIFWIAVDTMQDPKGAYTQLRAFSIFSILLAGFGLYAANTGNNPILGNQASDVVSASFVNRNNYATFAAFGLVTCLTLLLRGAGHWEKQRRRALLGLVEGLFSVGWLWIVGLLLCGGALMLTESRGGAVAAVIGVLAVLTTVRMRGGWAALGPVAILGGMTALVLISASSGTISRMITTSDEEGRFAVYPLVWEQALERPLLGHGLGAFEDAFRIKVPVEAALGAWDKAHNSYLENIHEMGLPAAALFYLALALIGVRLVRGLMQRRRDRAPVTVAFACFLLAGFHALFDFSLQMPALAGFFAWLIGIGYVQSFSSKVLQKD